VKPIAYARLVSSLYDAAIEPQLWPAALQSIADAFNAVGAACIIFNKETDRVSWLSLAGPSTEFRADYVSHFATLDLYSPLLRASPDRRWLRLSRSIPKTILHRDEWYNDFVLRSDIIDIIGARLFECRHYVTVFGVHQAPGRPLHAAARSAELTGIQETLRKAAQLQIQLSRVGWRSEVALRAKEQLAVGLILTDAAGRVVEMNEAAELSINSCGALAIRNGRLEAQRAFERKRLGQLIAAACAEDRTELSAGRMLVGNKDGRPVLIVTVTPLSTRLMANDRPLAMLLVADADRPTPSAGVLAELFGLTPAESRLTVQILAGAKLPEISSRGGVQISTLRTHLSSILQKLKVERQTDLVRLLANLQLPRLTKDR